MMGISITCMLISSHHHASGYQSCVADFNWVDWMIKTLDRRGCDLLRCAPQLSPRRAVQRILFYSGRWRIRSCSHICVILWHDSYLNHRWFLRIRWCRLLMWDHWSFLHHCPNHVHLLHPTTVRQHHPNVLFWIDTVFLRNQGYRRIWSLCLSCDTFLHCCKGAYHTDEPLLVDVQSLLWVYHLCRRRRTRCIG